jgi:hypothetical protein
MTQIANLISGGATAGVALLAALALIAVLMQSVSGMVSAIASERIGSNLFHKNYDHDPDSTNATLGAPDAGTTPWVMAAKDFEAFGVEVRPTVLAAGAVTKVELVAASNAALSSNLTVIKDSGVVAADALADVVFVECLASEIKQLAEAAGVSLAYVGVRITASNAGLEANISFIGLRPRFPRSGLTATAIT